MYTPCVTRAQQAVTCFLVKTADSRWPHLTVSAFWHQLPVAVAISKRQLTLPPTQADENAQNFVHFVNKLTQETV